MRSATVTREEAALLERLRAGDERAFEALVESYYGTMLSIAQTYVRTRSIAEEVVQDAWLGILRGLDRFEGRSSLKTWIISIVINIAKTRGVRESRSVPFASLAAGDDEPVAPADRFRSANDAFPGHWWTPPADWRALPQEVLLGRETLGVVKRAIGALPDAQRTVIAMRDLAGCSAEEVCDTLSISEGNQRVLLHRARARVRAALERHLNG